MTKTEAIDFFKGPSNLARLLDITPNAIYQWPEKVPARAQWPISILSNWSLMPDDDLMPAGFSEEIIKNKGEVSDERVSKLLMIANELAQRGKGDVVDALSALANYHL